MNIDPHNMINQEEKEAKEHIAKIFGFTVKYVNHRE